MSSRSGSSAAGCCAPAMELPPCMLWKGGTREALRVLGWPFNLPLPQGPRHGEADAQAPHVCPDDRAAAPVQHAEPPASRTWCLVNVHTCVVRVLCCLNCLWPTFPPHHPPKPADGGCAAHQHANQPDQPAAVHRDARVVSVDVRRSHHALNLLHSPPSTLPIISHAASRQPPPGMDRAGDERPAGASPAPLPV